MRIGDIITHVLDKMHPAVQNNTASDGDEVPVIVTHVSEDGSGIGTALHPDGTTSVVTIPAPEAAPETAPEAAPVNPNPADTEVQQ